MIYPDFVEVPSFSVDDFPAFEKLLADLPAPKAASLRATSGDAAPQQTHIFVCTHRTRDCRCGDIGEPLYDALLREIKRRRLGGELKAGTDGVRIARVAHIGGHKWAGNALVYRSDGVGDWFVPSSPSAVSRLGVPNGPHRASAQTDETVVRTGMVFSAPKTRPSSLTMRRRHRPCRGSLGGADASASHPTKSKPRTRPARLQKPRTSSTSLVRHWGTASSSFLKLSRARSAGSADTRARA